MKYDWSNVPKEVKFLTTNESGIVSGWVSDYYKPSVSGLMWYGADHPEGSPRYYKLNTTPYQGNWQDSLEGRPK